MTVKYLLVALLVLTFVGCDDGENERKRQIQIDSEKRMNDLNKSMDSLNNRLDRFNNQ